MALNHVLNPPGEEGHLICMFPKICWRGETLNPFLFMTVIITKLQYMRKIRMNNIFRTRSIHPICLPGPDEDFVNRRAFVIGKVQRVY